MDLILHMSPCTDEQNSLSPFTHIQGDVVVVLVPGVSLSTLSNVLEPLRILAKQSKVNPLNVDIHSCAASLETGVPGAQISGEKSLDSLNARLDARHTPKLVIFCSGPNVPVPYRDALTKLLRKCALLQTEVIAISGMVWLMAENALLPKGKATLHWSSMQAFQERFPDVEFENTLFVTDGKITCCPGEMAALDMMVDHIKLNYSENIANSICDELLIPSTRSQQTTQPGSQSNRLRNVPQVLQCIAATMAENIENPLKQSEVAERSGISQRQIERLFQKHLYVSPAKYYQRLRLDVALQLVEQTNLPIVEIALATGFRSPSTLSKRFKEAFGKSPNESRTNRHMCATRSTYRSIPQLRSERPLFSETGNTPKENISQVL